MPEIEIAVVGIEGLGQGFFFGADQDPHHLGSVLGLRIAKKNVGDRDSGLVTIRSFRASDVGRFVSTVVPLSACSRRSPAIPRCDSGRFGNLGPHRFGKAALAH